VFFRRDCCFRSVAHVDIVGDNNRFRDARMRVKSFPLVRALKEFTILKPPSEPRTRNFDRRWRLYSHFGVYCSLDIQP
jgi:hypothetical protein